MQIPIEIGYRFAKLFAQKDPKAKQKAEMLGLMVNDPALKPEDVVKIQAETLVISGTKDVIKTEHTKFIARSIPNAKLVLLEGDHFIANKMHEKFNAEVEKFLA